MKPETEIALRQLEGHTANNPIADCEPCMKALATIRKALETEEALRRDAERNTAAFCGENERLMKALGALGHARIQIRFDGPPGPEAGRFVEVETVDGKGISIGEWVQDGDYWLLRLPDPRCQQAPAPPRSYNRPDFYAEDDTPEQPAPAAPTDEEVEETSREAHGAVSRLAALARRARYGESIIAPLIQQVRKENSK